MMQRQSTILIISPEAWSGHFVSKHHYAITLASQGYDVYFLNPPDNTLKDITIQKTKYENLWEIFAPQVAKGLRFYPKFLRNYYERKWLEKLEVKISTPFTTVWLFENSRFYDMDFSGDKTKIYHQVDLNQNFHVQEAASSADICFCTTEDIQKELLICTDNVHKIHHGVSLAKEQIVLEEDEKKSFLKHKINVVYVGNVDISFFDVELFVALVENHPLVMFHLVGNYDENNTLFTACQAFENIQWWGKVESSKIPRILNLCDMQLLIYKAKSIEEKKQLASPHKMMEYLASGKVTVATYTDEYKDKRELLEMVDDSSEYLARCDEVVHNLAKYNSQERQSMRIDFTKAHSYEKQLEKIVTYLKQYNLTV